jgi:hypothetical protein
MIKMVKYQQMDKIALLLNKKWVAAVIVGLFIVYGVIFSWAAHDHAINMGDQSTFYTFAHNIAQGEVIYDDFIHFRTPGSYFLNALGIVLFGDSQSSVNLILTLEATVFYPLCFFGAIFLLFWKSKWLTPLILLSAIGFAAFPPIIQLRSGLALLAVSFYVASGYWAMSRKKRIFFAGLLSGVAFMFGQETGLMAVIAISASEIVLGINNREFKKLLHTAVIFAIGGIVGALPLIIYSIFWSDFGAFLYYTLYYAFVLQPKFMDLPYPVFSRENIEYYLPFIIYGISYFILYASKWKYRYLAGVILGFAILRLITLLGRSDWGHLMFAITEMFVIIPVSYYLLFNTKFTISTLKKFIPYLIIVSALFVLSINYKSVFIVIVPIVILWSLRNNLPITRAKQSLYLPGIVLTVFTLSTLLIVFTTKEYFIWTARLVVNEVTRDDSKHIRIQGMKVDPVTYKEISEVKKVVEPLKPDTIFSYPIQPFYYSLAEDHASRFMTFEPQTTVEEQQQAIADLRKNKPDVVILDPLQAQSLSGSLWLLNNFVTENYQKVATVKNNNILWVMVPKAKPSVEDKIALNLYHLVSDKSNIPLPLENEELGITNALLVGKSVKIPVILKNQTTLKISVAKSDKIGTTLTDCGALEISSDRAQNKRTICVADGIVEVPLNSRDGTVVISLSGSEARPTVWNNITLTE